MEKLKYGVDVHGVIADNPIYWRRSINTWLNDGHEVHILSGPPEEQMVKELASMDIVYSKLFSIVDYHRSVGTEMIQDSRGNWHLRPPGPPEIGNYLWDRTKADYCLKNSINFMFDDSDAYKYFFKPPTVYCRVYSLNKRNYHFNVDLVETK